MKMQEWDRPCWRGESRKTFLVKDILSHHLLSNTICFFDKINDWNKKFVKILCLKLLILTLLLKKMPLSAKKNRLRVGCRLWKIYFKLANGLFLRENLNFKAPCRNFTWNFLLWKGKVVARQIINNDDITDYGDAWIKGQHVVFSFSYWTIMKKPKTSSV